MNRVPDTRNDFADTARYYLDFVPQPLACMEFEIRRAD